MMPKPRILLLGSTGMLGSMLVRFLHKDTELTYTGRSPEPVIACSGRYVGRMDIKDFASVQSLVRSLEPDEIINCIGLIKQKAEGKDPVQCIQVNSLFPHLLAKEAKATGSRVITFSTDCVFSGKSGNYSELDPCDAEDIYGKSKYLGELIEAPGITIRSSIIGPELNSAISLFDWFRGNKGGSVNGFTRAIYSGVTTLEMAKLVRFLVFERKDFFGRWNVASQALSKFELLQLINAAFRLNITVSEDSSYFCDRSLNGDHFLKTTGYKVPSWPEMVAELRDFLNKSNGFETGV